MIGTSVVLDVELNITIYVRGMALMVLVLIATISLNFVNKSITS